MMNFWTRLTELIQKYTLADAADLFVIIGGLATIVAAVGAIIAVVFTKRIAANQNELFKEQNKISAAQVEMARLQNSIALFKEREEVFNKIERFFQDWSILGRTYLSCDDNSMLILACKSSISLRHGIETDYDAISKLSIEKALDLKRQVYHSDLDIFIRLSRLFSLDQESRIYLTKVIDAYCALIDVITAILENKVSDICLKQASEALANILESSTSVDIISILYKQIIMTSL